MLTFLYPLKCFEQLSRAFSNVSLLSTCVLKVGSINQTKYKSGPPAFKAKPNIGPHQSIKHVYCFAPALMYSMPLTARFTAVLTL